MVTSQLGGLDKPQVPEVHAKIISHFITFVTFLQLCFRPPPPLPAYKACFCIRLGGGWDLKPLLSYEVFSTFFFPE